MKTSKSLDQFKQMFNLLESILELKLLSTTDFDFLFLKINIYEKTRGGLETIKMLKNTRVSIYNYVAGRKILEHGISTYKDGIPKILGPKVSHALRSKDHSTIRAVLTALMYSRMIDEWKEPDTSTITDEPTYTQEIRSEFRQCLPIILSKLFPNSIERPIWENPHFTTKSSPQGIAMMTLKDEMQDLKDKPEILRAIFKVADGTLEKYFNYLLDHPDKFNHIGKPKASRKGRLRSIGIVKDTEGKSRVIAMADYWTQTALKPLHEKLLNSLRDIKSDVTFGQNIGPFGRSSQTYYSFDLTAATDRLPRFIYEDILEHLFGKELQEAWTTVMIDLPFHWKDSTIKYNTGQPMGMYSSWALLAIGHHAIVQYSAMRMGAYDFGRHFHEYRLLGDDIVIRNDLVAHKYAETLQKLGVQISPQKSLVSKDTFEFAKRLFHAGEEVTGFPIDGWISTCKLKWIDQASIVETAVARGYPFSQLVKQDTLIRLQEFTGKSYDLRRKISRNILTQMVIGKLEENQLKYVGSLWGHRISCVTSGKSFRRYVMMHLSDIALQTYLNSSTDTMARIQALKDFKDDKFMQKYRVAAMVASQSPKKIYPIASVMYEPYVHVLCSSLHQSIERQNNLEDKYTRGGMFFTDFDGYLQFLRKSDLRIPNIYVRDPSRKSERGFKFMATASVRALSLQV